MSRALKWLVALGLVALLVFLGEQACVRRVQEFFPCESFEDCADLEFPLSCPDFGGAWVCEAEVCVALCFQCDDDPDCTGTRWDGDPPTCPADRRFFECQDKFCKALCDTECEFASECVGKEWPSDARCQEADGHWECNLGFCTTVCDGCSVAADCEALNPEFPKCCEGHWECNEMRCDAVCDLGCEVATDCVGQTWPEFLECTEDEGRWDCVGCECEGSCVTNCDEASDCLAFPWDRDCEGRWACDVRWCTEHCGETCGDGLCKAEDGETLASCPTDCDQPCTDASDCVERAWGLPCQGRFGCDDGDCLRLCDYESCGDGVCDEDESVPSCPDDCLEGCRVASDCFDEAWTLIGCTTGGSHTCISSACGQLCGPGTCGNRVCERILSTISGESGNSCAADCGAGPCDFYATIAGDAQCNAYPWKGGCGGHWECATGNRCEPVCEGCPDGTCDVLGGESPSTCPADCEAHRCVVDADCDGLFLPPGCTGSYLCFERVCVPMCS